MKTQIENLEIEIEKNLKLALGNQFELQKGTVLPS